MSIHSRRLAGAITGATLMLAVALPAAAHVSIIDGGSVPSGGHGTQISFRVGHGCDGVDTDSLLIQIPEGVTGVKPKWMAGWTAETEQRVAAEASVSPDASAEPAQHAEVGTVVWSTSSARGRAWPMIQAISAGARRGLIGASTRSAAVAASRAATNAAPVKYAHATCHGSQRVARSHQNVVHSP